MSLRNNQNGPVKVAAPSSSQSQISKAFETPEVQKIMKALQEDISAVYEDLSNKYKIFNPKFAAIVDEIVKFDASIGEADATLSSIKKIQEALSTLVSAIKNEKSKKDIKSNLDLLEKLRSKQSEKSLDVMPSIAVFKTYIENINNLIVDAQTYVTVAFDNEKKRSELISSLILCANKFGEKCVQAKLLADARTSLREKQKVLDEVEIPQCKTVAASFGTKPTLFATPLVEQLPAKMGNPSKQMTEKENKETGKKKSIFAAVNSDSAALKSHSSDKARSLQSGKK